MLVSLCTKNNYSSAVTIEIVSASNTIIVVFISVFNFKHKVDDESLQPVVVMMIHKTSGKIKMIAFPIISCRPLMTQNGITMFV